MLYLLRITLTQNFNSPGQLGTSPAVFRVGCTCRSVASTDTNTVQLLKAFEFEAQRPELQLTDLRHPTSRRSRACMLCAQTNIDHHG